jgi:hypothetical protein
MTLRKNRHRKLAEVYAVPDHNAARWFEVRFLPEGYRRLDDRIGHNGGGKIRRGHNMPSTWIAGWYVVRVCPCHDGLPVSKPMIDESRARRVLATMLRSNDTK